jgi:hypothetical protein
MTTSSSGNAAALERLLHRPIFGGVFGFGRYALASMPCVSRGLHATRYMVVEPQAGAVLSVSEDKVEALAGARRVLVVTNELAAVTEDEAPEQLQMWPDSDEPTMQAQRLKPVCRRRREIFDKSQGKCHYCSTVLTLDGRWHVEHMMPRALGGGDDLVNLVAACVPCNLGKADRTAIEFVAAGY